MYKKYKTKLTEIQIQNIYKITDNKDKQSKIMSILTYLMKYTEASTMKLLKSINKLFNMYSVNDWKYHAKIARSYFYDIANLIIDNNYFFKLEQDRKVDTLSDKINSIQTLENTNIEADFEKTNNIINNNTITYTLNTAKAEKVAAIELVDEVCRDLKIKSKIIKSMVISKLQNVKLDAVGAISYILKVITEKTEQYNAMRVKYAKAVAETKYSKAKNTFTTPATAIRSFNNFEAREYDYDDLEKKLLGWE